MSTQAKLDAIKAKIEQNHEDRDAVVDKHKALYAEQLTLEATLADEPKLRHGDYGIGDGDHLLINSRKEQCTHDIARDEGGTMAGGVENGTHLTRKFTKYGNIFDDLKAMSEDLTELTLKCDDHSNKELQIYQSCDRSQVCVKMGKGNLLYIKVDDLPSLATDVKRLYATLKRRQS